MQFKNIIAQQGVKQRLIQSVLDGRIPHAQLFWGPSGIGKLQLAIAYAQYLACPNRTPYDSCGECPTCRQFQRLEHPDLHFVFPVYKTDSSKDATSDDFVKDFRSLLINNGYFDANDWYSAIKADTKQCLIYASESSSILHKLSLKAYSGGYKCMIIWLPEKMHNACANKLLKLLEEPPEFTIFLLVSEEPDALLPTILSRVQQIKVPTLAEDDIAQALIQRDGADPTDAADLAHIANGSYLRARKQLQVNEDNKADLQAFQTIMRIAYRVGQSKSEMDKSQALIEMRKWCKDLSKNRERVKRFLLYAQQQVRENYICNFHIPQANYQTTPERTFSARFAPFINDRNVESIMNELQLAQQQIEQNGYIELILFDLAMQLMVNLKK